MRIALLKSQISKLGGLEKVSIRLAKAFIEKGHSLTLLTSGKTPEGIPSVSSQTKKFLSFHKVKAFDQFCQSYLNQNPQDVVLGMDRNRFQTHLRAGNGVHAAFLEHRKNTDPIWKTLSFSINPLHRLLLQIEKESFESPSLQKLFVNSFMVKKEILEHYKVDSEKIEVVHNGVEWHEMQDSFDHWEEEKPKILKELGLSDTFHFLFIGHNYKRKGLEMLLEALSFIHDDFHLSVVGKEKDIGAFKSLCHGLKLHDKVSFFGARSDIRKFYQFADALVIPSFYDPFANVTVEALAMGLFVVSSKTNGGHEVLKPDSGQTIEDLFCPECIVSSLKTALKNPKTKESSLHIRNSVSHLDFSKQLKLFVEGCL